MHTMLAAYRLVLVNDHDILKSATLAPAITYALGLGALYGLGRMVRDIIAALPPTPRRDER